MHELSVDKRRHRGNMLLIVFINIVSKVLDGLGCEYLY